MVIGANTPYRVYATLGVQSNASTSVLFAVAVDIDICNSCKINKLINSSKNSSSNKSIFKN